VVATENADRDFERNPPASLIAQGTEASSMNASTSQQERDPRGKATWSFLIYIAGDNDLSDHGLADIRELCNEGASDKVRVLVEIDTAGEYDGSLRYEIQKKETPGVPAPRTVIARLPEHDSGDPKALLNFLIWGLQRCEDTLPIAVVWGHGSGFRTSDRDVAYDYFGTSLDMTEIREILDKTRRRMMREKPRMLEILGFDACLMSMIEIGYEFRDYVKILVGSQQTEPAEGWPYDKVLARLKHYAPDPASFAKEIVRAYIEFCKKNHHYNVTQSAVDLGLTQAAVPLIHDVGGLLGDLVGRDPARHRQMREIRLKVQNFASADYIDLIHFLQCVEKATPAFSDPIVEAAARARRATRNCILNKPKEGRYGEQVKDAHGLSVWFPNRMELFEHYRPKYAALEFAKDPKGNHESGWLRFLDTYHLGPESTTVSSKEREVISA
jgi:hypothetical protein